MTQQTTGLTPSDDTRPAIPDIVTPASARALFWRPRYVRASDDLWHLPFLFWLTDLARPRVMAAIGVADGVAYFATCQAMDRLDRDKRCHGVSPGPVAPEVAAHNEDHYGDFSDLRPGTARSLAGWMADGTVDLLSLHGVPDAATIAALSDEWPRKMSARGVIVLHGVAAWPAEGPARGYLDALGRDHPVISFEEGGGLVAVLRGADQPGQLTGLAALDVTAPGAGEVRHVFRRLGSAVQTEWAARDSAERAAAAQARAREAEAALAEAERARAAADGALSRLRDSHEAQAREVVALQARLDSTEALQDAAGLSDLMRRHAAAQEELGALRVKLTGAEDRAAAGRAAEAAARDAVATAEAARGEAERMAAERVAAKDRALQQLGTQLEAARDAEAAACAARETAEAARAEAERMAAERVAAKDRALQQLGTQLEAARDAEAAACTGREIAEAARAEAERMAAERAREDLRVLTERLEAGREERDAVNRGLQELKVAHAALRGEADRLRAERDGAQAHVAALLGSTSWKLTAPVRRVVEGMRRRRGGAAQE